MNKFYIPTSSLNFNNILSSESISPKVFYASRSFGYGRWTVIPENPFENSIVLYDQLCSFSRPKSDIEDHPLLVEICLDDATKASLLKIGENAYLSDHTIYIDPFSTRLLFFSEKDRTIAFSLADSSIETKLVWLYSKRIEVIAGIDNQYQPLDATNERQGLKADEIEKDKRINRMKGLLYGYYIGAILSTTKDLVIRLNNAREIHNILAAILASYDHKATSYQRSRLQTLYSCILPEAPFYTKLRTLIPNEDLFNNVVSLVKSEYGFVKGEFNVDNIISRLLSSTNNTEAKNPQIEEVNVLIRQIENTIIRNSKEISIDDEQIVTVDGNLRNVKGLSEEDQALYIGWVNDVLSKDSYNGKVSTFKEMLSDDVTHKAKDMSVVEWKGSYPEKTLNALRRHVRGEDFLHKWENDIFSSISAVIVRGDDWQKLLQYMQSKEMTDYRIAFSMYGTLNGFANLPRDFTDILFSREKNYIASVYKEFYGQLFGRDVVVSQNKTNIVSVSPSSEDITEITSKESSSPKGFEGIDDQNQNSQNGQFENLMATLIRKCKGAEKDKELYKSYFFKSGGLTQDFVTNVIEDKSFNNGKGVQKTLCTYLGRLFSDKARKPLTAEDDSAYQLPLTYSSTLNFLTDYDYLINDSEFCRIMASYNDYEWRKDLKWFIDAHNDPTCCYYQNKPTDNKTVIEQFLHLKDSKYGSIVIRNFLEKTYLNGING